MRRSVVVPVAILALALAACSSDDGGETIAPTGTQTGATTGATATGTGPTSVATSPTGSDCADLTGEGPVITITISGFAFDPSCFTASVAQGISVANQDGVDHTFTMVGTQIDATIPAGETFNGEPITGVVEPGTYDLLCKIHPTMTGEVTVVA